jgi:5-methylcytosine-specific restriction enzyme A
MVRHKRDKTKPQVIRRAEGLQPCALCGRTVAKLSQHHLVPKSEGGTEKVGLCAVCHKTLHSFFSNQTLAREKHTIEMLQQDPAVQRYLGWVRKQPDSRIQVHASNDRY